jgi:6-phosphofructokinase 1
MSRTRRIGILTGGGDCPGLNAVIRAAVEVGARKHHLEFLGIEDAFHGLVDPSARTPNGNRWLTPRDVHPILARGGTILGTSNRSDPFHYVVTDPDGSQRTIDISARVLDNARALDLEGVISIGGDGSMKIAQRMIECGLPVVGVPKTIDNDLDATDQTFGFDTAVGIATEALDRLRDTAESHDRVMLVEVMGRDAGFIALHAGLAGGAEAIVLPEVPYRVEALAAAVEERRRQGQIHCIFVVSEGARPVGGQTSVGEHKLGAMPRLVGAAQRLGDALQPLIKSEVRVTVLGHLQRGGTPSSFDRILATRFGHAAAELVAERHWNRMVALRAGGIVSVPIAEAIARPRRVDPLGPLVGTARALGVAFGDEPLAASTR